MSLKINSKCVGITRRDEWFHVGYVYTYRKIGKQNRTREEEEEEDDDDDEESRTYNKALVPLPTYIIRW